MLAWIAEKGQIDFGNLAVGLGTVAVALVSFYLAFTTNVNERNRIFVNYAGLWIEEMRKTIAEYLAILEAIPGTSGAERQNLLTQLREKDIYIRLKFDRSDPDAGRLFPLLDRLRDEVESGAPPSSVKPIVDLFREIFETKWRLHTDALSEGKRRWRWR